MDLIKSPLHSKYIELNAKLTDFAGWEMPISFSGLIDEHNAVRNSAGVFDISHMGVISIKGVNPKEYLQKFFPTNLFSISVGQSCYSLMLNETGGVIDDLIIYDLGLQEKDLSEVLLIVNASRYKIDLEWLENNLKNNNLEITNAKKGKVLIALQGKESFNYFEKWSNYTISHLPYFGCEYLNLKDHPPKDKIFISKTGYTGENGLEILLPIALGINLWNFLINHQVKPCGLGARDTLRLEAGLHLYGQELNENTTPYEAGLGWLINLENNYYFYGRKALEKQSILGIRKKLVGIEIKGKAIARKGYKIFIDNQQIGEVTSGSWSPSLKKPIALAYINYEYAKINTNVDIIIRGEKFNGIISKRCFYKKNN